MSTHNDVVRLARLIPVFAALLTGILLVTGGGCGKGLFQVTNSGSVTATSTAGATKFLYASNHTDGKLSAFSRNTSGTLTFIAQYGAGAVNGPMGVAITPNNRFLYLANSADNSIREFRIGSSGALSSLGSIPAGTAPQIIAIDHTGSFVYATNATSKSISEYSIGTNGGLTSIGLFTGFGGTPFGVVAHPTGNFLYMADNTAGLIYAFTIGSNGVLSLLAPPVSSNGGSGGQPGLMTIAIDSSQGYLMVGDMSSGVVSVFVINSDGTITFSALSGPVSRSQ